MRLRKYLVDAGMLKKMADGFHYMWVFVFIAKKQSECFGQLSKQHHQHIKTTGCALESIPPENNRAVPHV